MYCNGEWTQGRYNSFIKSILRSGFRRWKPKYDTLAQAFVGRKVSKKTGKLGKHYRCAKCRKHHPSADVQVDHINPIVDPEIGHESWDKVVYNMYCDSNNLQVLCKTCHAKKTKEERSVAAKGRAKRKVTSNGT